MLDAYLAVLYGVRTKRLNEQVRRNRSRFPDDFIFQLTAVEVRSLRSQLATSKQDRGGRRYAPLVFTEQGIAMLSTVLNSERAIQVNIQTGRDRPLLPGSFEPVREYGSSRPASLNVRCLLLTETE